MDVEAVSVTGSLPLLFVSSGEDATANVLTNAGAYAGAATEVAPAAVMRLRLARTDTLHAFAAPAMAENAALLPVCAAATWRRLLRSWRSVKLPRAYA